MTPHSCRHLNLPAILISVLTAFLVTETSASEKMKETQEIIKQKQFQEMTQDFMKSLKAELMKAVKAGGIENGIEVCHKKALSIAETASKKHGVTIARTSLKVRNPANQPDDFEKKVLLAFEAKRKSVKDIRSLNHIEKVATEKGTAWRYLQVIPTGAVCLNCHGENIPTAIAAKIKQHYPKDMATGFKLGDIRGAFTITEKIEK